MSKPTTSSFNSPPSQTAPKPPKATSSPQPSVTLSSLIAVTLKTIQTLSPHHLHTFINLLSKSFPSLPLTFFPPPSFFSPDSYSTQNFVKSNICQFIEKLLEPPVNSENITQILVCLINLEKTSRFGIEEEQLSTVNEEKEKDGGFKREWGSSKAKVKPKGAYEDLEASFSSLSSLRRSAVPGFEPSEKLLKQKKTPPSSSPHLPPSPPDPPETSKHLEVYLTILITGHLR
ncbi:hypothetical protein TL16_g12514 [Triparma laevis f. inornata]|uniref:Uncharacterized protein n=1 Tax=Triparma laevis f. inornata TaxID=1714386 RepID=A0A9W7BT57_9STRA|nr:hypothetical protein TL16_g12514 [Triparma laevis f. inornata]